MKGRPEGSIIRDRITGILNQVGTSYGYEIYSIYKKTFGPVHIRTIYYNLKKGIEKEEIILVNVAREIGDYSWGDEVEKVYYTIGPYAKAVMSKTDIEKLNEIKEKGKAKIDWKKEISGLVNELDKEMKDYIEKYGKLSNQAKKILKQRLQERHKKIMQYSEGKISKEELNELIKDLNPDTL